MAFKLNRQTNVQVDTPEALFRDLRNRRVEGLLSHQADILRAYQDKALAASDVALQLPTGSGKTLVGLLIGEWRRRRFEERVVYLCPTKQLVNQVVEQAAKKYGLKANAFTGKQADYAPSIRSEFLNAESVAVTTYSGLFNTNSFFENPNVIILDDAHAAENYIAAHWSLQVSRTGHPRVFEALKTALRPVLSRVDFQKLHAPTNEPWDTEWVDKLPTPILHPLIPELTSLLDMQTSDSNLKHPWSVIRDHLFACHLYMSTQGILIRPVVPPTLTHPPFASSKQRIYMSATLGSGGDLERITGVEKIERLPTPEGWDKQGIGRRLFFFPERSLTTDRAVEVVGEMVKTTDRALMLVTNDATAEVWNDRIKEKTGYACVDAKQIETSKEGFVTSTKTVAVIANRYDGIDFIGDECRLLFVYELPRAVNLQERFLMSRLAATFLLNDRVQTRIIQAVGRCTRSATDYAAVVILGESLTNFFLDRERRAFLHPEVQAELRFGIEQSRNVKESDFMDNLKIFLEHGEEWNTADEVIVAYRADMTQKELPGTAKLRDSVKHEVKYQYAMWRADYPEAVKACNTILTALSGDEVKGYRAFWNYLAGSAAWMGAKNGISEFESVARDYFKRAAAGTTGVLWLRDLSRLQLFDAPPDTDRNLASVIEALETQLELLGTANDRKFENEVKAILDGLNGSESDGFENAHERLGRLLGYQAGNSDSTAAPDPWWIASDKLCFVFEDHSPDEPDNAIGANKTRQAATHPKWIAKNVSLHPDAEIVPVMISPRTLIDPAAATYTEEVGYWNLDMFRKWAAEAIGVVRTLRTSFPGAGHLEWREGAMQHYRDARLDPEGLKAFFRANLLGDLERPSKRANAN